MLADLIKDLKDFSLQCILFKSSEKIFWLLGALEWAFLCLLLYAIYNIFILYIS